MIASLLTPIIIMLGVAPDLEAALYFTVVVLILLGAGWALLELVFAQRRPATRLTIIAAPASPGRATGSAPGAPLSSRDGRRTGRRGKPWCCLS